MLLSCGLIFALTEPLPETSSGEASSGAISDGCFDDAEPCVAGTFLADSVHDSVHDSLDDSVHVGVPSKLSDQG